MATMERRGPVVKLRRRTYLVEEEAKMKIIKFVRLKSWNNVEYFLVKRGDMYYALVYEAGTGISFDAFAKGKNISAVEQEFDRAVRDRTKGVKLYQHGRRIATREVDTKAMQHLKISEHPSFGIKWETTPDARDNEKEAELEDFHRYLSQQIMRWKGSVNRLRVSKHSYWPVFQKMVRKAIREKYGSGFRLYRGVTGKQAIDVIRGRPLKLYRYSAWTRDIDTAKEFRDLERKKAWVIVSKIFKPKNIVAAPVQLPDYEPNPAIFRTFAGEDEFIVNIPRKMVPVGKFEIHSKTRKAGVAV